MTLKDKLGRRVLLFGEFWHGCSNGSSGNGSKFLQNHMLYISQLVQCFWKCCHFPWVLGLFLVFFYLRYFQTKFEQRLCPYATIRNGMLQNLGISLSSESSY